MDSSDRKRQTDRERQRRKRARDNPRTGIKLPRGQWYQTLDTDIDTSATAEDSDSSVSGVITNSQEISGNVPSNMPCHASDDADSNEDARGPANNDGNDSQAPSDEQLPVTSQYRTTDYETNSTPDFSPPSSPDPEPDPEPDPDVPGLMRGNRGEVIDAEWLANALVKVRTESEVSDAGIQKICDVFLPHLQEIKSLLDNGQISGNYRHGIRPKATVHCPKIWYGVKVRHTRADGETELIQREGLQSIPSMYVGAEGHGYELLSQTSYTTLEEIKEHFSRLHPEITGNELESTFCNVQVGIDGVRESNSGPRTLLVISVMLSGCINCWKIINPLMSVEGAKPTLEELLM